MRIKSLKARKIQNSRGETTIEVVVNKKYVGSAPSGASKGKTEVKSYSKQGLDYAIKFINKKIDFRVIEFEKFEDLEILDRFIEPLGGNPVVALQSAVLKAMSDNNVWSFLNPKAKKMPRLLGNVIGGGKHTKFVSTDVQEFLLSPKTGDIESDIKLNSYLHRKIGKILNYPLKTDEGAWAPNLDNISVFKLLHDLLSDRKNTLNEKVELGIDMAASSFYYNGFYNYHNFSQKDKIVHLNKDKQVGFVNKLIKEYDLMYVEDPLDEKDFKGFAKVKGKLICGDDLITTNIERLKTAIRNRSVNSIIIKPNQIGSLVKTKKVMDLAKRYKIKTIISHRSGETMDPLIAHLAVGWKSDFIKCGIYGKERVVKLKELIRINDKIKKL